MSIGGVLLVVLVPTLILRRWGWSGLGVCAGLGFVAALFIVPILQMGGAKERVGLAVVADRAAATPASEMAFDYNVQSNEFIPETEAAKYLGGDGQAGGNAPANEPATASDAPAAPQRPHETPAFGSRQLTFDGEPPKRTARLSVPVDFEVPESYVTTQFAYSGTGGSQLPDLDLRYHGRELNTIAPIAVALFVMLWFWFARSRSFGYRAFLVAIGLLIPMAVAPLVPSLWQIALEGIFFGTLGGIALWFLHWCLTIIKGLPVSRTEVNAAAMLLVLLAPSMAFAQTHKTPKIVVPYDEGGEPLEANRVFIPQATFLKLWRQANPDLSLIHI